MYFYERREDWICLHCGKEFPKGTRGGMFDHVNTIDEESIRTIIIDCNVMKTSIVITLHPFTLRNLLMDLSRKVIAIEIIKNWNMGIK